MASDSAVLTTQHLQHDTTVGTIKCTAPIPFGGEEQWLYQPATTKFDLTRGSQQKMVIESEDSERNHSGFIIDPGTSVMIIVDMQNYFVHPMYRDHAEGIATIEPTLKVIERCRREGIQIAWLGWGITDHDLKRMAPAVQRGFSKTLGWHIGLGAQLPDRQGRCLFKRSWNAELYEPMRAVAEPGDLFFDKTRMSGLWSTDEPLHEYLRATGKQTLLFAGVNTDQCVFGTVSDAYSWGWDCVLINDCTGTMTGRGAQELAEYQVSQNMGFVTNSTALSLPFLFQPSNSPCTPMLTKAPKTFEQMINDFLPSLTLSVHWLHSHAKLGNTIEPKYLQDQPSITLHDGSSALTSPASTTKYVITLTDPDAPSRQNPKWSEMCHWIAANVSLSSTSSAESDDAYPIPTRHVLGGFSRSSCLHDVLPYKPPGPPEKTGKHRYVFLVFASRNGSGEGLGLTKPAGRKHWGQGKGGGVRGRAEGNGLVVVGGNFVYAENEQQ
ncbi:phosphatidylethanolamine-binding protein [Ampelomyces quisqualis]|uniref:Phosphatidylethanolamine-binding protein n=1 Tax=Ampelomyces quisqualis TaxID=50730 RepID=A0A6A5Q7T4_AMPQU|nr:phosphatidylethanolamine-binding protein [Ampelomyces quisqualis]